jgi:hypothetical protein
MYAYNMYVLLLSERNHLFEAKKTKKLALQICIVWGFVVVGKPRDISTREWIQTL